MSESTPRAIDDREAQARLQAAQVPGLGPAMMRRMLECFGSVGAALEADPQRLRDLLGPRLAAHLADTEGLHARWRACAGALARLGARAIALGEADYPPGLYDLSPPPAAVYVKGRLGGLPGVAIVGRRRASKAACHKASVLAAAVVEGGGQVVSGGAYGIDAAAHLGAMDVGGCTVVVFGGGLDRPYPDRHIALFERAATQGNLLSPFRPGTPPVRGGFLARNAVIAALSGVVVVVDAGWRSGARSTALAAFRLGRRVCAVPGSPGCDRLLAEGAEALRHGGDVSRLLAADPSTLGVSKDTADGFDNERPALLDPDDAGVRAVLDTLEATGSCPEAVALRTGLAVGRVQAILMALVLEGRVAERPGGSYFRADAPARSHDREGSI